MRFLNQFCQFICSCIATLELWLYSSLIPMRKVKLAGNLSVKLNRSGKVEGEVTAEFYSLANCLTFTIKRFSWELSTVFS